MVGLVGFSLSKGEALAGRFLDLAVDMSDHTQVCEDHAATHLGLDTSMRENLSTLM